MTGIEPAFSAWEADVLPLNYIRMSVSDLTTFLALVDAPPALPPPLDACPACDNTCCHGVAVRAKEHAMSVDERLPDPELLRTGGFRLATHLYAPGDVRGTRRQLDSLRTYAQAGDPLADDLVSLVERLPRGEGRALFERALGDGIDSLDDPPPELVTFFRHADATPYWVDHDRLESAARAIVRTGLLGLFPLADMSLMGGYLASRATNPLVGTGALVEDMAARRLVETTTWWLDVTTPGALH